MSVEVGSGQYDLEDSYISTSVRAWGPNTPTPLLHTHTYDWQEHMWIDRLEEVSTDSGRAIMETQITSKDGY